MNPGAGVTSIDVLNDWYAALVLFRTDAQNALTSAVMSLQQAEVWLDEQQHFWQRQIRKYYDEVVQAKAELAQREYTRFDGGDKPDTTVQEENLRLALGRMHHAEDQLEVVRRWMKKLPVAVADVFEGPTRQLAFFLDCEIARGLAMLERQLTALEQYAHLRTPAGAASRPAAPSKPEAQAREASTKPDAPARETPSQPDAPGKETPSQPDASARETPSKPDAQARETPRKEQP